MVLRPSFCQKINFPPYECKTDYAPYFVPPDLFKSQRMSSPFRALVKILLLKATFRVTKAHIFRHNNSRPCPQATSVLALSIFSPLPSQKLRDASILCPPFPTAYLWSGFPCCDGSDTRKILKAEVQNVNQNAKKTYELNWFTFSASNHAS